MKNTITNCRFGLSICNPIEILKCRAQANKYEHIHYTNLFREILHDEGVRGLFKGFWPLFWREIPGWAIYFWSYEYFKTKSGLD